MRSTLLTAVLIALASCAPFKRTSPPTLILWAWERPENLRFLKGGAEIAVQTGFIELEGDRLEARGRRFPLLTDQAPGTTLVHVQIDNRRPLNWTPALRGRTSAAILHYARAVPGVRRVQVDFEVRASERQILLDVLRDVRRGLPRGTLLSMTALASWCDTERWLADAPVDEIVPMLFRMQAGGEDLKRRLAGGEDFRNPRCRAALAVATDSPIVRAPPGRRVYLFNPRSWTEREFAEMRRRAADWK